MASVLQNNEKLGNVGKLSDLDLRYDSYLKSLDAFLDSPIVGIWDKEACGGHSFLFDNLGLYGLIGLVAYVILWLMYYRVFLSAFVRKPWFGFFFFSLFISISLSILNPHVFFRDLGIVIPVLLVVFNNKAN